MPIWYMVRLDIHELIRIVLLPLDVRPARHDSALDRTFATMGARSLVSTRESRIGIPR